MSSAPRITLLTDFGLRDGYVGAVKGVLSSRCPRAILVDLTHDIEPRDVASGAWALGQAARWFPPGTVHLAVVDPGVGTERRGLACRIGSQLFVAPDNGLLDRVLASDPECVAHELTREDLWNAPVSPVFHGRDVFAPAAAWLADGGALAEVGPELDPNSLVRPSIQPAISGDKLRGEFVHRDRFGNLTSNLHLPSGPAESWIVEVDGCRMPLVRTYGDVSTGDLLALVGSEGYVEVACNGGSAAERLGAGIGHVVMLRPVAGADPA